MYNDILATLLPVETPLLADIIEKMNFALARGVSELKWNSSCIDEFIKKARADFSVVDELDNKIKDYVRKMQDMMGKWEQPLFD